MNQHAAKEILIMPDMNKRKHGTMRKIDDSLGLHELGQQKVFQLRFMKQQCEGILEWINVLLEKTYHAAPLRQRSYMLTRQLKDTPDSRNHERLLEAALWKTFGPNRLDCGVDLLPNLCRFILTFQTPIFRTTAKEFGDKIDLIGVSSDWLPVVFELKKGDSPETPLRMLVEAAAYGIAIRKAWNEKEGHLAQDWAAVVNPNRETLTCPMNLQIVPLVCIAPASYWAKCIGLPGKTTYGKVRADAWGMFSRVVDALNVRGLPAVFVQFDEGVKGKDGLPSVQNLRVVDLPRN